MRLESIIAQIIPVRKLPFLTDGRQINPEINPEQYVISKLVEAREIIREHRSLQWIYPSRTDTQGTTYWEFIQYGIPDEKYGTRPINYEWIFSSGGPDSRPNFTLSAITVTYDPDDLSLCPVQPEIRIRFPPSGEERTHKFVSFGDLAVCIGLRSTDGSISPVNSENLKSEDEILARAQFVVDTFITHLNSLLLQKP